MKDKLSQFERDNRVAIQKIRNDAVRASDRVSQTSEASMMNIKQQLNTFMDFVQKRDRQTENTVNTIESKVNDAKQKVEDIRVTCDAIGDAFLKLSKDQTRAHEKAAEHRNQVNERIEEIQKTLLVDGVVGGS